jgi:hypothetical protein
MGARATEMLPVQEERPDGLAREDTLRHDAERII